MDFVLKQVDSDVCLYIDKTLITVFKDKDINFVINRIQKNFKNSKIHILR